MTLKCCLLLFLFCEVWNFVFVNFWPENVWSVWNKIRPIVPVQTIIFNNFVLRTLFKWNPDPLGQRSRATWSDWWARSSLHVSLPCCFPTGSKTASPCHFPRYGQIFASIIFCPCIELQPTVTAIKCICIWIVDYFAAKRSLITRRVSWGRFAAERDVWRHQPAGVLIIRLFFLLITQRLPLHVGRHDEPAQRCYSTHVWSTRQMTQRAFRGQDPKGFEWAACFLLLFHTFPFQMHRTRSL